jgi:prepilin-type N-terminal cleavage/methylation domain-containing protein
MLVSKKTSPYGKGFTLIEVMIFITILSVVFVAMAGYTAQLIFSMKINEHKTRAAIHAEVVKEWLNGERETDWAVFLTRASAAGTRYCMNAAVGFGTEFAALPVGGPCGFNGVTGVNPPIFRRELILTRVGNQVNADIVVSWMEGETLYRQNIQAVYVE